MMMMMSFLAMMCSVVCCGGMLQVIISCPSQGFIHLCFGYMVVHGDGSPGWLQRHHNGLNAVDTFQRFLYFAHTMVASHSGDGIGMFHDIVA